MFRPMPTRRPLARSLVFCGGITAAAITLAAAPEPAVYAQLSFTYTTSTVGNSLGLPPYNEIDGISASGNSYSGYYYDASTNANNANTGYGTYGYYVKNGVQTTLDATGASFAPSNAAGTISLGINDNGYLTGYVTDNTFENDLQHFIYDTNTNTYLTPTVAGSASTFFNDVAENNLVAGGYLDSNGIAHGAIYDINANAFTLLSTPAGIPAGDAGYYPQAIAANGDIVATTHTASDNIVGLLVHNGAATVLSIPSYLSTTVIDVVPKADVNGMVSGYYNDAVGEHGFFYSSAANTWYSLEDPQTSPGNTATFFSNSSKMLAGSYVNPDSGFNNGMLVTIRSSASSAPEPSALALILPASFSLGGMLLRARRRKGGQHAPSVAAGI